MNKLKSLLRLILGVVGGALLGNALGVVLSLGIDSSYGYKATGGDWPLSWPNILYIITMSLLVGFFAGFITKRRGKLAGALAQFVPLMFVITLSLILNRDLLGAQDNYQTKPALWTWIGLIPAIIGGALGEHLANDPVSMDVFRRVRWHWLWVWMPLVFFLYSIAGSIRFVIADVVMTWEILFIPRLWILLLFGLPLILTLFYFAFSLPARGTMALLGTLAYGTDMEDRPLSGKQRIGYICFWAVGVPVALIIIWWIDTLILSFLLNRGLKIP
jgi:hypothetical protein